MWCDEMKWVIKFETNKNLMTWWFEWPNILFYRIDRPTKRIEILMQFSVLVLFDVNIWCQNVLCMDALTLSVEFSVTCFYLVLYFFLFVLFEKLSYQFLFSKDTFFASFTNIIPGQWPELFSKYLGLNYLFDLIY